MVFSSISFLFYFLPLLLILYFMIDNRQYRNRLLTVFSLIFYAWGEPIWVVLMLASAVVDFRMGLWLEKADTDFKRKLALIGSLVVNLSLLGFFKYGGFMVTNLNMLLGINIPFHAFGLPIGISFYTFQTLSYTIDVYRGQAKVQHKFLDFLLFVSLFHQLVAGPIVRYTDIAEEINGRKENLDDFVKGIHRLLRGLFKKVIFANIIGQMGSLYLNGALDQLSFLGAWFGSFCFALQIYFDFSGYSDMAIGLGWMFGFHYKENFNYPYISKSITEFWRRWHISLGAFFRDYVYIPLGGNRQKVYRNAFIVWLLTGLWHGASWNFALWGLFNGVFIMVERRWLITYLNKLPRLVSHVYFALVVLVGWVIFYFDSLASGWTYLTVMFGNANGWADPSTLNLIKNNCIFLIITLLAATPFPKKWLDKLEGHWLQIPFNMVLLVIVLIHLIGQSFNPFLYFRF